ncbi:MULTISPECIES: DUF4365 domain-containing protein [unclassified Pseudofrankia]|uniref:DUF4365 domain-containing protein n=1 Tax=unclassified Pseudofrankia TaxID=2994372 RepID=UPI0008D8D839|nr:MULTISPECIES: DUF4365 domain-containing protein [unclassified Pseudofrankia]MDT3438438.1 DUF4365 domain-containing protein [Pseudofrankia sp. BMG5.37]OHV45413.1 hypothetical protein BCD48_01595 [Pseudofrankia sp. BMG5.36]
MMATTNVNLWLSGPVPAATTGVFPTVHASGAPYGQLFETNCREQISIAYAQAVVTAARCKLEHVRIDDEKVDAVIRQVAEHDLYDGIQIDIQLKCTSQAVLGPKDARWPLERDTYNRLRSPKRLCARLLVLMVVPPDLESWVTQDEDGLRVVRCAYWRDLLGEPELPPNVGRRTVDLPRSNIFNVQQLLGILARVGRGENP